MGEAVSSRSRRSQAVPVDDLDVGLQIPVGALADRIWRLFVSMRTGLMLILALAVLTLIGTVLVQVPSEMRSDPQAYAAWLDSIRPKYGGWTPVLDKLGFFAMFTSPWFRAVSALLATSIMACSVRRAPLLWRRAVHPRIAMSDGFYTGAPLNSAVTAQLAPDAALETVRGVLRRHHMRVTTETKHGATYVHADRFRWGPWGTISAHLSIILILAGAVVGSTWGYRDQSFTVPVGAAPQAVGGGTGLSVQATSFSATYYPDGSPSDYATQLTVFRGGDVVAQKTVRVNQPLQTGDVAFYQAFFGGAVQVSVKDAGGKSVYASSVPLEYTSDDGKAAIGRFSLPDGKTVYVAEPASGQVNPAIRAGQLEFDVYTAASADNAAATAIVSQGQSASLTGLTFTFDRERQFSGLIVARDPGAPLVWAGAIFLVLGILLVFYFPHRRVWVRIRGDSRRSRIEIASAIRRDETFAAQFARIATDVSAAAGAAHTS